MTYKVLTAWELAVAAVLLIVPAVISLALRLGMERTLAVAAVRTVAQLYLLAMVLEGIFAADRWYLVAPVLLVMFTAAAHSAIGRSQRKFPGAYLSAFVALMLANLATTLCMTQWVLAVEPWYEPRYLIPLVGMLLGNGLTGISLGLDRLLNDFVRERTAIEARLALGASLWQAALPWVREAVRSGMTPIINSMMIVGVVSLPGVMTGQILAGVKPTEAVGYQVLIMFMIAAATALSVILLSLMAFRTLMDPMHRLRWELILATREGRGRSI